MNDSRLLGRCVEVGDDDDGQPRLVIHTTREQLLKFARNLAYADVEVTLHSPGMSSGVPYKLEAIVTGGYEG